MKVLPKPCCSLALLLSVLVSPFELPFAQRHVPSPQPSVSEVVILWNSDASGPDSVDQESYAAMTACLGFRAARRETRNLDTTEFDEQTLLLVPHASSRLLSREQAHHILGKTEKGMKLLTGGEGQLLSLLHFQLAGPCSVRVVLDRQLPRNHLHWADRPLVRWIAKRHTDSSLTVLYADSATAHSLVVKDDHGKGKYILLGPHLDPLSGQGYSRFPTMANAIVKYLGCGPSLRRQGVDAYFDPGYRFFTAMDSLAAVWKSWGIHAVHTSAWYYDGPNRYDYNNLISAAHRNGILVYAWLEWPHVGRAFWERHPEWREKNALLQDARLDWLLPMDLQNPDCMRAALEDLSGLLRLDWDGIDIAEFTITGAGGQALAGPSRPDWFTNFGPTMRNEFERVKGFDPIELVDPNSPHFWRRDSLGLEEYYDYRKTVNNRLLRQVVESILHQEKREKRDWELIHTIVDNSLHPEFDRLFGFDFDATLQLVKRYGITLNVEDPYMEWEKAPVRYRRLREKLLALLPEQRSMIDINVVPIHPADQIGFSSYQATGTELLQLLQMASERRGRVCVYSESTVFEEDWPLVPYAMSAGSVVTKEADSYRVNVPLTMTLGDMEKGTAFNNGKPWPCYGPEGVVLPAGTHHIAWSKPSAKGKPLGSGLRLIAISDELVECKASDRGFDIAYSAPARCLVSVSARPKRLFVDGVEVRLPILKADHYFVLLLPSGRHRLKAVGN